MEVQTVGGIDPSSKKIVIVSTHKNRRRKPDIHKIYLRHDRVEDNCLEAFDFVVEYAMEVREQDGQSPRLYLEAPIMGVGGPGATIPQAFISGSIMSAAAQTECHITLVNNQSWKKRVLGKGNLNKDEVTEAMQKRWPEFMKLVPIEAAGTFKGKPDQDTVDAGAINLFGWHNVTLVSRLRKRRKGNG